MAWNDDKTTLNAQITGTEWNTMVGVITTSYNLVTTGGTITGNLVTTGNLQSSGKFAVGTTPSSTIAGVVAGTSTYNSDTVKAFRVADATTPTKAVDIGFDTSRDTGFIQAGQFGTAYKNLELNLAGGSVILNNGVANSDFDFGGYDAKDISLAGFKVYAHGNTGTSTTINWNNGAYQTATLTGNCTFTFTAPTVDTSNYARLTLVLSQDGTGSRTATWPATVKWPGGTAPTLTTTASREDIITLIFNGTNYAASSSLNFDL